MVVLVESGETDIGQLTLVWFRDVDFPCTWLPLYRPNMLESVEINMCSNRWLINDVLCLILSAGPPHFATI